MLFPSLVILRGREEVVMEIRWIRCEETDRCHPQELNSNPPCWKEYLVVMVTLLLSIAAMSLQLQNTL